MSRFARKASRGLIGLLLLVIVIGAAFYLNNVKPSDANEPPMPSRAAVVDPPATHTPRGPTTQPASTAMRSAALSVPQALALKETGDLVGARKMLNDALLSGKLSKDEAQQIKQQIAELNKELIFSPRVHKDDPFTSNYTIVSGDVLARVAARHNTTWELLARINNISDPRRIRVGQRIKIINGPIHAVVTKSQFMMDLYFNSPGGSDAVYLMSFPVGLGSEDSTPTGLWICEPGQKIKNPTYYSPRGEGVIAADDPNNPLGERWIALTGLEGDAVGKTSYGIHGTIEPESIGRMESMGCIRLLNEDVELLFDLLVDGKSKVKVVE